MEIHKHITPIFLEKYIERINHSEYCVIDTNIPQDTIKYLCEKITIPFLVKTVSLNKNDLVIY